MKAKITLHPGIEREIRVNPGYIRGDSDDAFMITQSVGDNVFAMGEGFVISGVVEFVCLPAIGLNNGSVRIKTDGEIKCTIGN